MLGGLLVGRRGTGETGEQEDVEYICDAAGDRDGGEGGEV